MIKNKLYLALSIAAATSLTACGGGGDAADDTVKRNVFAVGDVFKTQEDGDAVEADVSLNDFGSGLTFALESGSTTANGKLVFNADGTFTYTPNADFSGKDTFTYVATHTASGDTASAVVTINVISDFETIEESGWTLTWSDEFDSLDSMAWDAMNASAAEGVLSVSAVEGQTSYVKSTATLGQAGRIEASIQLPDGKSLYSGFGLMPMADMFDGKNALMAIESANNKATAGGHWGIGLVNGVEINEPTNAVVRAEFHTYAIEWNENLIRWYIDDIHIHTVDTLNTWSYNLSGDTVVADTTTKPFSQDLQIMMELTAASSDLPNAMLVDYVKVYECDTSVTDQIENCAFAADENVDKLASNRIESVGEIVTPLFTDELASLSWHYTDAEEAVTFVTEQESAVPTHRGIVSQPELMEPVAEVAPVDPVEEGEEGYEEYQAYLAYVDYLNYLETLAFLDTVDPSRERGAVIRYQSDASTWSNFSLNTPSLGLVGKDSALQFDMYIDSASTTTETIEIRMETGWPFLGTVLLNVADLQLDTWVTYNIPVSDFLANPFITPDWAVGQGWFLGGNGVEGQPLYLDTNSIAKAIVVQIAAPGHLAFDNVAVTCVSNESCFQGPLAKQPIVKAGPAPIIYEAEAYTAVTGEVQTEDTQDVGGGQNVGYIDAGDALEYTIVAPIDGTYKFQYRLASGLESASEFDVSIDDMLIDGQSLSGTGGWQVWTTLESGEFDLTAGEHTVVFNFAGGMNFNWFAIVPPPIEIFIEAEDYSSMAGVQLEDTADEGGGQNVGYIDAGDFLQYNVEVPADGTYFIELRVASSGGSDGFTITSNGITTSTIPVADTGGWQNWTTQTVEMQLSAGQQTLRFDFIGGAINFNWISITN